MGTEGIEPSRLSAHDPKSCSSASSDTSPEIEHTCVCEALLLSALRPHMVPRSTTREWQSEDIRMIRQDIDIFLRDCRSRSLSHHTVAYYRRQLAFFQAYCESLGVLVTENITVDHLRQYLISLEEKHNPGGRHARYRAVKVFMLWFGPENWSNPMQKSEATQILKGAD
jgi:hypothetical protein